MNVKTKRTRTIKSDVQPLSRGADAWPTAYVSRNELVRTPSLKGVSNATRNRLLSAAENLFAERGCHATSVRDLATRAGVNLAAVCYHFGSKQRLLVEALARQIRPLNAKRLAALDSVIARSSQPTLEDVLEAFARTFIEEALQPGDRGRRLHRLISRAFAESDEVAESCFREELLPTARQFLAAIRKARPDLSAEQAALGLGLFAGSTVHILRWIAQPLFPEMKDMRGRGEELLNGLIGYGVGGFDALGAGRNARK